MSRAGRKLSQTGLYHIIFRGMNRQNIFEDEMDYRKLMEVIQEVQEQVEFKIYAYCLMSNHVHLFLEEKEIGDISKIMHKILTRYAGWYNKKYQRSGILLGNRYKSQVIEKDSYLLSLVRYIHQNPKKAGMVNGLEDYKWSSYNYYIGKYDDGIVDTAYILEMLSEDNDAALNVFIEFHNEAETEVFEISDSRKKTEEQIRRRIKIILEGKEPHAIGTMPKDERNRIIKDLRQREGFSIREIERATGIPRGIISRIR